ncbi:hypothetical protein Ancab_016697 [Ancistrocladus abbreviatus]
MPEAKAISRRAQSPPNPRMTPLLLCSSIRTGSPNTLVRQLKELLEQLLYQTLIGMRGC